MNKIVKLGVSLGLVGAAVGYMAYAVRAGGSTLAYDKNVDEVMAAPASFQGKLLRVGGMVVPGSITKKVVPPNPTEWRFRIMKNGKEMEVHFVGTPPDTFTKGTVGVTVEGTIAPNGRFTAKSIVAKCPSKYDEAEEKKMKAALADYEKKKKETPKGQPVQFDHPAMPAVADPPGPSR